jgi:hypothetical protein
MPDPYRHSIAELVTRYEFEPELRDIYVEGDRDYFFLGWFFKCIGRHQVVIYTIEASVDVPARLLAGNTLFGNRGRVIGLCMELATKLSEIADNVLGLVDKDYSEILNAMPSYLRLLYTEFSCLECYALSEHALTKFCHLYLGYVIPKIHFDDMFHILAEIFLLRCAKLSIARTAPWLDIFTRLCSIRQGHVTFDRNVFIDRLLNASAGTYDRGALEAKVTELRLQISADFRQKLNGHDLIQIFSWYAHQVGVDHTIYSKKPLHRALLTSVELEELQVRPLFQRLSAWSAP